MKLGIVIYSNDLETVWNAFRLGVFSRKQGDAVSVFLLGKDAAIIDVGVSNTTQQSQGKGCCG